MMGVSSDAIDLTHADIGYLDVVYPPFLEEERRMMKAALKVGNSDAMGSLKLLRAIEDAATKAMFDGSAWAKRLKDLCAGDVPTTPDSC